MGCQLGEVTGLSPALAQRLAPEPGDDPDHIHGRRRQGLLEMRACQPQRPTPAEIETSYPLREAALHPRPQGILRFELGGFQAVASGLERLMVDLWADRELAGGCLGGRARPAGGTRTTGGPVKPDANDRVA